MDNKCNCGRSRSYKTVGLSDTSFCKKSRSSISIVPISNLINHSVSPERARDRTESDDVCSSKKSKISITKINETEINGN